MAPATFRALGLRARPPLACLSTTSFKGSERRHRLRSFPGRPAQKSPPVSSAASPSPPARLPVRRGFWLCREHAAPAPELKPRGERSPLPPALSQTQWRVHTVARAPSKESQQVYYRCLWKSGLQPGHSPVLLQIQVTSALACIPCPGGVPGPLSGRYTYTLHGTCCLPSTLSRLREMLGIMNSP